MRGKRGSHEAKRKKKTMSVFSLSLELDERWMIERREKPHPDEQYLTYLNPRESDQLPQSNSINP